jgi:hypothetical protein
MSFALTSIENIDVLFPQELSVDLRKFAREFTGAADLTYRSDAFDSIMQSFPTGGEFRRDAVDAYYVARQLEFIKAGVDAAQFPAMKGAMLVPMDTTPDDGANTYLARQSRQVGRARVSRDMAGIIPDVDVAVSETAYPILSVLLQYGYTLQEVRASLRERKALPTERALRCREQIMRELDAIALVGHTEGGLKGLFNQTTGAAGTAAVGTYTIPNGGSGTAWSTKTAAQILDDWHASVSQVVTEPNEIEVPNTSVLPLSVFEYVSRRQIGDGTIDTVLTAFKRNNAHIKTVESSPYLEAGQAHATETRMVNYERNPLKVSMILPVPFEQLSPDVSSTETKIKCHARTAGTIVHRPRSMVYANTI